MKNEEILNTIQKIAEEIRFDLVGVADIESSKEQMTKSGEKLEEWINKNYHGDMKWFVDSTEKRKDILKVMPDAKSVICVAMNYYCDAENKKEKNTKNAITFSLAIASENVIGNYGGFDNPVGKIARYARGRDYHKIFDKKLKLFAQKLKEIFPESEFKYYCDTGPVLERVWAVRAGLGFVGKNTNLITKYGSWVLLGEIITNIAISDQRLAISHSKANTHLNSCGSCRRCLNACPTGALIAPYIVDARRCISYLTIEHKGEILMELRGKIGNRIFGCDACQEVCPFNIGRQTEGINFKTESSLQVRYSGLVGNYKRLEKKRITELDLKEILSIKTDEEFLKMFAGSPLMRAKRRGLVRNACVAAGNSGNKSLLPNLKECLDDKEPIIAIHAKWAIEKIEKMIK